MISVATAPTQTQTSNGDLPSDSSTTTQGSGGSFLLEILNAVSTVVDSKSTKADQSSGNASPKTALQGIIDLNTQTNGGGDSNSKLSLALGGIVATLAQVAPQGKDGIVTVIPDANSLLVAGESKVLKGDSKVVDPTSSRKSDAGSSSNSQQTASDQSAIAPNLLVAIAQFQSVQTSAPSKDQPSTSSSSYALDGSSSIQSKLDQIAPATTQAKPTMSTSQPMNLPLSQMTGDLAIQIGGSNNLDQRSTSQGVVQSNLETSPAKSDGTSAPSTQVQSTPSNSFEGAINQALNSIPATVNRPVSIEVGFTQSYSPPTDLATPLSHIAISLLPHSGGSATVELSMSPANLGPITATLSVDKSTMTVVLGATNQQTAELLTRHSAMIATELSKSSGLATTIDMSNGGGQGRGEGGQRQSQFASPSYSSQSSTDVALPEPQIVITSAHVVDVSL